MYGWVDEVEKDDDSALAMKTLLQIRALARKDMDAAKPWSLSPVLDE